MKLFVLIKNTITCTLLQKIMRAECVDTQSKAMKKLSLDQLCMVLNFAVSRLKHTGVSSS